MALDSLLASLKNGVTGVTRVTSSNSKACSCNPTKISGVTGVTNHAGSTTPVTLVTPRNPPGVTRKPLQILDVTPVTPVTQKNNDTAEDGGSVAFATHENVAANDSSAVAVEPAQDVRQPLTPMAAEDEAAIRSWLKSIGENSQSILKEVIKQCQKDAGARGYFLGRANPEPFDGEAFEERAGICEFDGGLPKEKAEAIAWNEDDRRRCTHCLNLLQNGVCKAAGPGGPIVAARGYRPDQIPRRCPEYRPCPDDPDRRPGRERWPGLEG